MNNKKYLKLLSFALCLISIIIIIVIGFNNSTTSFPTQMSQGREVVDGINSEKSFNHIHSIQYLNEDDELYIATHMGLYGYDVEEKSFFRFKNLTFDIMGFSISKSSSNIWYLSGHSIKTPNIGLLKSQDYGNTFERVFSKMNIFSSTVDFHSLKVSPINSSIVVGFYDKSIHISENEGESFSARKNINQLKSGDCYGAVCISLSPTNHNEIFAITNNSLYKSLDLGKSFSLVPSNLNISYVLINENNTNEIFIAQENYISKYNINSGLMLGNELVNYEIKDLQDEESIIEIVQSEDTLYLLTTKSRILSINLETSEVSNIV